MALLWWFDQGNQGDGQSEEQPEPEGLPPRQAEQRGELANRSGSYLMRWEARYSLRWRLTLWERSELAELDHGAA